MTSLELKVPPPIWAVIAASVIYGVSRLDLGWDVSISGPSAGLAVGFVGVAIAVIGVVDVMRAGNSVDPHDLSKTHSLVTNGVYRMTRNPMYLGLAIVLLGWALALEAPVAGIVGVGGFVAVVTRLQIIPEERMLAERFPNDFEAFRQRTRRWI